MTDHKKDGYFNKVEASAVLTIIGVVLLFSTSIMAILIAPNFVDSTWTTASSPYQVQMYEVEDPNIYISSASSGGADLQYVHHLKQSYTLLVFKESDNMRILAPEELDKYITRAADAKLKLTSRLLLLRTPEKEMAEKAAKMQIDLQQARKEAHPEEGKANIGKIRYQILELYDPKKTEAFSYNPSEGFLQNWVDKDFIILDDEVKQPYHSEYGVVYVQNPQEYRIKLVKIGPEERWVFDPKGQAVSNVSELLSKGRGFHSRKELIEFGEHIYAIEGCWYCHTEQTRTLIQDVVLNGSDSFPAPPSSANEYIYQKITFPGTRRIGPDLSRTGVKRPSRDWHMSHFWDPKTASAGSIMPSFRHFFDFDPRGTRGNKMGIPNYQFEAIYQYLMTKGTRITPPTQAWWLGLDPIQTKEIIEGQRKLK